MPAHQHDLHGQLNATWFRIRRFSHIPDKGQVMAKSFGLHANANRGENQEGEPCTPSRGDDRGGAKICPRQGLGRDDPEGP
jgi:hypothetical protein